ncbi:MAG: hypothetical protein FK730_17260 [Asgard group archaeon]|nr:hypothetical protein [Asgard group archaeon]
MTESCLFFVNSFLNETIMFANFNSILSLKIMIIVKIANNIEKIFKPIRAPFKAKNLMRKKLGGILKINDKIAASVIP